ncbi:hypothetical protein OV208_14855 [Corallococcus sp. bb12-1]|uniref:hypothetical protein n=1 Tax=Corallococcus sp. bb12-1 TaxID=2996784 RepID=UPI00226D8EB3|nr:hypothetical protein [Corallococcus sp. bb12-1]MCY1042602.1 hypothetical protein [Corallococcus sp. bb12-1]
MPVGRNASTWTVGGLNLVGGVYTALLGGIGYVWASEPAVAPGHRGEGLLQASAVSLAVGLVGVLVMGCSVAFMLGHRKAWLPLGLFDGAWLFFSLWLGWSAGTGWLLAVPVSAWLTWQCWASRK